MNKYVPHVYVIAEDDRDRQLARGFVRHHRVNDLRIKIMPPAGGWPKVLKSFQDEYVQLLRNNPRAHVVMLIDFDDQVERRRSDFDQAIPNDLKSRVFVVGAKGTPETLRKALNKGLEEIGTLLADDCHDGISGIWDHDLLQHNDAERQRMVQTVKPFLF